MPGSLPGPRQVTLTTRGRRTGQPRDVRLYAFEDGDRLVVVGSAAGAAQDPHWVANLRVEPDATVSARREISPVRAREVAGQERDRLWELVSAQFPLYETYQRRTSRRIPLFVLQDRAATVAGAGMATCRSDVGR